MNNEAVLINPASSALTDVLLDELALSSAPVSVLRLTKRLRVRLSSLLRCVAYLGEDIIADNPGPGWVLLHQDGDRVLLSLTQKGRDQWQQKKWQQKH
ncbi:hypothetical protein KDM87_07590 [Undibacterium sp. FT147W]|uniref:Uncharacterized protein n=1 Tax=Undibacterium rivi TaxID=2828729 RepID=A0ABS5H168_9BURK|nr:hypothetical protein [Undibacterium rivi]MBR7792458.1 hypothetical protein [Undibacterium rivi]